jgi:L-ornithine N5-monooxygenase
VIDEEVEVLAIGAGPSNLALAVAIEELGPPELAGSTLILEQCGDIRWQRNLLLPWARSQVSFVKDLVTLRNPRSRFSFLNFLHDRGRLDEFVNLATFNPYRKELSDYLQWVAWNLQDVRVRYNARCASVTPRRADDGTIEGWTATLADGDRVRCRDLVVAIGRDPHVPEVFHGLPRERIIHSTEYGPRIAQVAATADWPLRAVVVGGAQSAAEVFMALHDDLPLAELTLVARSIGLQNYQTSKFVNELFFPSFVGGFYDSTPEARREILAEMRQTNYAGLAAPFLDEIYYMLYRQKLLGSRTSSVRAMTEVVGAREDGAEIVLDLRDRKSGKVEPMRCDLVLLGTGYEPHMPALMRGLAANADLENVTVSRSYRVDLGEAARGGLYLQGTNEQTHGIADSLLSVLAHRSQDIVADLLERRSATPAGRP